MLLYLMTETLTGNNTCLFYLLICGYLISLIYKLNFLLLCLHTHKHLQTFAHAHTHTHTYTHTHTHTRAHRTEFVSSITRELPDTSPSDLLLVQQEMTQDSSNETGCVNITLRVLGTSCKTFLMLC